MTDRPIIFSGPMVRALLYGRKTQTRRLATSPLRRCEVGDRLYVREAFSIVPATAYRMSEGVEQTVNPADPHEASIYALGWDRSIPKWKPSILMPRWASRLTLNVTDIRVQRLQEISEHDAIAESLDWVAPGMWSVAPNLPIIGHDARVVYSELWNMLHTEDGETWDDNPEIVALTFTIERGNIDRTSV